MSTITLQRRLIFTATIAAAAVIAWFTTGCRDTENPAASNPAATPRQNVLFPQTGQLFACAADSVVATDTATIGPLGGSLSFGPHTLFVPPGALLARTTIIATAPADGHLTAVLQPEGLQFILPATLTLGYSQCNPQPSSQLGIVYLNGPLGQILQWLPSILHLDTHTVSAPIGHFSVYAGAERR